jgi:hypothetical protein
MSYILFGLRFSHPILIKKIKKKLNKKNAVDIIIEGETGNRIQPALLN